VKNSFLLLTFAQKLVQYTADSIRIHGIPVQMIFVVLFFQFAARFAANNKITEHLLSPSRGAKLYFFS